MCNHVQERATVALLQPAHEAASAHSSGVQGETVCMKLPGQQAWSAGTCLGPVGPRSYKVRVNGSVYMYLQNRHQLVNSKEPPIPEVTEMETVTPELSTKIS